MARRSVIRFFCALAALTCAANASAQTAVSWLGGGSDSKWFTGSNWSGGSSPNSNSALVTVAAAGSPFSITTGAASSSVSAMTLNLSSAGAALQLLFDFSSSGYGLNLGTGTSAWTAGTVEFRNSNGLYGNGTANTSLTIGSGVELLYSTDNLGRNLYNLTAVNNGTIHATSGTLYLNSLVLTNQAGGLIYADGAEIDFTSNTTLANLGIIRASGANGKLYFQGNVTTANLGTVQLISGGQAYLNSTIDNTGATLAAPSGGSFQLYGGTINNGTIASGALKFTTSSGTLNNVTLNDDLTLGSSERVALSGGTVYTGANTTLGNYSTLYWKQAATLAGKSVTMSYGSSIYLQGNNTLTLAGNTTIGGDVDITTDGAVGASVTNQGNITHSASYGSLNAPTFTNSGSITANSGANLTVGYIYNNYVTLNTSTGTITADGTNSVVNLGGNVTNQGTLAATNAGQLIFQGSNTTGHLGNVQLSAGGQALLNGTLDNTGATLTAPTGGKYQLYGGTITNGSIGAGALGFTTSSGTLGNVTILDDLTLNPSERVTFTGGTTYTGANTTLGNYTTLYWNQTGSLAGKSVAMSYGSSVYVQGNNTFTVAGNTSVSGDVNLTTDGSAGATITNLGNITQSSNSGSVNAPTFTNAGAITANNGGDLTVGYAYYNYGTLNTSTGTITADGTNSIVRVSGNVTNQGTIAAKNAGQLIFQGNTTTGNLGNVQLATGGRALLNGTLDNSSATLSAPNGGSYELYGSTIANGGINAGALKFTTSGGTLSGVSLNDDLTLGASERVAFTGGSTFTGANATFGNYTTLYWNQTGSLAGKSIAMAYGSSIYVQGNNSLTLGNSALSGTIYLTTDGTTGASITTMGNVTHTSGYGYLQAPTLTNAGNILATAGSSLTVGYSYYNYATTNTSTGTITADGTNAQVYLAGNFTNQGVVTAKNAGQLIFQGNTTTANLGNVQLSGGGRVLLNGTLDNSGATLTAPSGGKFELYGGTITNGSIAAGALTFTGSAGTLGNVSIADDLTVPASTQVTFANGTSFTGGNATLNDSGTLRWNQTGSLAGKSVTFGNYSSIYVMGNNTLTLAGNTTATGQVYLTSDGTTGGGITNLGNITHNNSYGYLQAPTVTNSGTITAKNGSNLTVGYGYYNYAVLNTSTGNITADGNSTIVYLAGNVTNQGTLAATNAGRLIFTNNNVTGNLGNIQLTYGGHVQLNGTLDNTGATLTAPSGGLYELYGGTITNGTIATGALTYTSSGGTLGNVTVADDLTLPANAQLTLAGGSSIAGANATLGNYSTLRFNQSGSVEGKSATMATGASVSLMGNNTLTVAANTTVTGDVQISTDGTSGGVITNQGNVTHDNGYGYLQAPTFNNAGNITATSGSNLSIGYSYYSYQTNNTGTITADGANTLVTLSGSVANQGTLVAKNSGTIKFQGNNTTANLGNVQIVGSSHVYLNGVLDNSAATLTAPTGGSYELYGGTINNGAVASGALSFTDAGGTLGNVSLVGNINLPSNAYANFTGGTALAGNASLNLASNARIYWQQSGTLAGNTLGFGSGAYLYVSGGNNTLTLDSATIGVGDIGIYSDGSTGTTITNLGSLTHNSGAGYLYANTFTNSGLITVSSGTLYLGTTYTGASVANTGNATIRLNGGTLYLQPPAATPLVNAGVIDIQSGTFITNNRLTNGTGKITGAGVVNGNLILAGGVLAPGNSGIGTLTFSGGTLTVTNPATLNLDLGGASADQLLFINPPSVVNIGSGLLTLNLSLVSAPTPNTVFNILTISSGGSGISGSFAGLPNTGNSLTANFGGNPYTFTLNYQPNFVSLAYNPILVPEPSTYALMAAGLALIGIAYRRRRRS
jgi:hypothetical protein